MDDIQPRGRGPQPRQQSSSPPWRTVPARSRPPTPPPKPTRPEPVEEFFRPKSPSPPKSKKQSKPRRGRRAVLLILILLLAGAAVYWWVVRPRLQSKPAPAASQQSKPEEKPQAKDLAGIFRVVATGDFITHDSVTQNARKPDGSHDFSPMLSEIKPFLENAHTRVCHDTVPSAGGALGGYPSFNAPNELVRDLAGNGCNVLGLASDHINDRGQAGVDATMQAVDANKSIVISSGINRSEDEKAKERYFNVGDGLVKFAYFSYTTRQAKGSEVPFGVNTYEKNAVTAEIKKVRETADFVLVSMCWGKEDSGDIQPEQDVIAQELADAGADVVFGHCTHVLQPVKQLKSGDGSHETIVYYSLGNALNSQLPLETLIGGIAVVDIDLANKKVVSAGLLPTYMHYEWTAEQKTARALNSRINMKLYPLDKASAPLAASQNGTTVEAQTQRAQEITNRFTPTKILTSADLVATPQ